MSPADTQNASITLIRPEGMGLLRVRSIRASVRCSCT